MTKFKRMVVEHPSVWSEVTPAMDGYKLACCDCGLVHDVQFRTIRVTETFKDKSFRYELLNPEKFRVEMRVRRNNRSTAQVRRHKVTKAERSELEKAKETIADLRQSIGFLEAKVAELESNPK